MKRAVGIQSGIDGRHDGFSLYALNGRDVFPGVQGRAPPIFTRSGRAHLKINLLKPSETSATQASIQTITGGMVFGGSSTAGGWVPGGSCSGIGSGSVGGKVGLSIFGSGVSAGIGMFIAVASFVLCSIDGQPSWSFDSRPVAVHPPELFQRARARTLCGRLRESPLAALTIKHKSVHGA